MNPQLESAERLHVLHAIFEASELAKPPLPSETAFAWMRSLHLMSDDEPMDLISLEDGVGLCKAIESYANRRQGLGSAVARIAYKIGLAVNLRR